MLMSKKGFTLIELMIVVSIIAVLSLVGILAYNSALKNSRDAKRQADLKFIQSALEDYNADQSYYPPLTTTDCTWGDLIIDYHQCALRNPPSTSTKIYLNMVPIDPLATTGTSTYPQYYYVPSSGCDDSHTSLCTSYCLYAALEGSNRPLSDNGCSPPSGYNYGVTRP